MEKRAGGHQFRKRKTERKMLLFKQEEGIRQEDEIKRKNNKDEREKSMKKLNEKKTREAIKKKIKY